MMPASLILRYFYGSQLHSKKIFFSLREVPSPGEDCVLRHSVEEGHLYPDVWHTDARGRDTEEELDGVSPAGGREDLISKVARFYGGDVVDDVNMVGTQRLDVAVLVGVGIGAGEVVTVSGDWRHEGGRRRHPDIHIRGSQTEICPVGHHWCLIKMVGAI